MTADHDSFSEEQISKRKIQLGEEVTPFQDGQLVENDGEYVKSMSYLLYDGANYIGEAYLSLDGYEGVGIKTYNGDDMAILRTNEDGEETFIELGGPLHELNGFIDCEDGSELEEFVPQYRCTILVGGIRLSSKNEYFSGSEEASFWQWKTDTGTITRVAVRPNDPMLTKIKARFEKIT